MARTFDGPLSAEDVEFLRTRYSRQYADHVIALHGLADGGEEAENDPETEEDNLGGDSGTDGSEDAGDGADDAESNGEDEEDADGDSNEDLIGDTEVAGTSYNPLEHTEREIKEHLATVSEDEKAAILDIERSREDREPRKGVLSLA